MLRLISVRLNTSGLWFRLSAGLYVYEWREWVSINNGASVVLNPLGIKEKQTTLLLLFREEERNLLGGTQMRNVSARKWIFLTIFRWLVSPKNNATPPRTKYFGAKPIG
jgi:hypothetical protein